MSKKRVAIIGAGVSGLTAIKCCLDEGLVPVCFEKSNHIGGLWHYSEDITEGNTSVTSSTLTNTAKEITCYSDFPFPPEFPNYLHHTKVLEYLQLYAEQFQLAQYVHLNFEILRVSKASDFSETGRWLLDISDKNTKQTRQEIFDAVLLCTGRFAGKLQPRFEGDDIFQGTILHSQYFRNANQFVDKKVVVVGFGNSAVDAAVDLSRVAGNVYLSARRGGWVVSRVLPRGVCLTYRITRMRSLVFSWMKSISGQRLVNVAFDHTLYGIKPEGPFNTALVLNEELPIRILSGRVVMKPNVKRFTKTGVIFEDDSVVEDVDAILLATGYKFGFPFLEPGIIDVVDNQTDLYKYVFPPLLSHPTLAAIGFVQPFGSLIPIAEMQCRWATRIFKGLLKLPSYGDMMADIRKKHEDNKFDGSVRHTTDVDALPFIDEVAELVDVKPKLGPMLFKDPKLALAIFFGPWAPYQYRLRGPGQWAGAREAILTIRERILKPLQTRRVKVKKEGNVWLKWFAMIAICFGIFVKLKLDFDFSFFGGVA